jgi:hypothetical protein
MSAAPIFIEISSLFFVVLFMLHRYSNFQKNNKFILIGTFVAWYFSSLIIVLLPIDISQTTYRQCVKDHSELTPLVTTTATLPDNTTIVPSILTESCKEPWSLVSPKVFPVLWRIIYWTSQALTWLILPFMQSFSHTGEFNFSGKVKYALISNAIYYGTYLAIFSVLLIYVAIKINIDGQKLKVIGITASNTWGLFLLVLLLGYGLVAVPRSLWYRSDTMLRLKQIYFKLAKLHTEKCESEERLEDVLNLVKDVAEKVKYNHPMRGFVDLIVKKCPEDFRNSLRRNMEDYEEFNTNNNTRNTNDNIPNEKGLVNLHFRLIKAVQIHTRSHNQWSMVVQEAFIIEDLLINETNTNRSYIRTVPSTQNFIFKKLDQPRLEWLYYCIIQKYFTKLLAAVLGVVTISVIWSEMTFFNKKPVLSIMAILLNSSRENYKYFTIEIVSCLIITYLCFCAYYAIFKMRIFNFYYLDSNHHTDEYSLIFSGMLLCRLTAPLCYNFLGLVHLDSHITKDTNILETEFTTIMGHMDVISFISDGFNIYFPILICFLCLATFFNLGGHILHFFGFEQFIGDAEITQDLIEDGKNLIKRGMSINLGF